MIVPSIDLVGGRVVQLVGGETLAIDAGEPGPLMERFSRAGEVAVIDIDAARGDGSNAALIEPLIRAGDVRVGGGIRSVEQAFRWLDAGASKVIIGTAATPNLLRELPRERVIVAADARNGEVVTHGWRTGSGKDLLDTISELKEFCGGFLVTFVEREGRLSGTDLDVAKSVVSAAENTRVTIAGGVSSVDEVAALHSMGADAQVGMALYDGTVGLGAAVAVPLSGSDEQLWPTVVVDEFGTALGLAWSSRSSLEAAVDEGVGIYQSRSRGIWRKGETSGATQQLLAVDFDCDEDALRFTVRQGGAGFCHNDTRTCWGPGDGLSELARSVRAIAEESPAGSNTARLLADPGLLDAKLREEVEELIGARDVSGATHELADVLYFLAVKAVEAGVDLADVTRTLDLRSRRVTRRPMERKVG
ncbi:MAG: phosphoribosyl-ATP diphosphatase [Acidimicrobiia bacterium]